jgi:hypothetical protein
MNRYHHGQFSLRPVSERKLFIVDGQARLATFRTVALKHQQ